MKRNIFILLAAFLSLALTQMDVSTAGAQEEATEEFMLEEVTVTAEKREENLQVVPRSVAVITSDDLIMRQSTNVQDMLNAAAGVTFQGFYNQVAIRGVGIGGAQVNDPGYEPSVQFNVDGNLSLTTAGGTATMFQSMTDVERIEVTRGPSGAINGRMASAGTINIVTKEPDFEKIDFKAGVTYGNYDTLNFNAAMNLPLKLTGFDLPKAIENLSFRVAYSKQEHDAYIHDQYDEPVSGSQDVEGGRVKMKWQPIDSLTLDAQYNYTKDNSNTDMTVPPINTTQTFPPSEGGPHPDDPWLYYNGTYEEPTEQENFGESLKAVYSTGVADITAKWSYSWAPQTCDPSSADYADCVEGDVWQEDYEVYVASPDDSKIGWMAGVYKYTKKDYAGPDDEVTDIDEDDVNIGFSDFYGNEMWFTQMGYDITSPDFDANDLSQSWAVPGLTPVTSDSVFFYSNDASRPIDSISYFGNVTIPLFEDKHRFKFGVRKSVEKKKRAAVYGIFKFDEDGTNNGLPHFEFVEGSVAGVGSWVCDNCYLEYYEEPHIMETSTNPTNISVGWEYDWKPDVMLYLTVNDGFKPGGISSESVPNTYYEPETQLTYSAGMKSRLFGDRLQLNTEVFVSDYDNLQLDMNSFASVTYTAGNGETYTQAYMFNKTIVNIGRTTNYGLTVDYDWVITGSDRLNGNFEFKDNKYGKLHYHLGSNAMPPGAPEWIDLEGRQMPFAPKFTFYGSYSHIFTLGEYSLTPRADLRYSTSFPIYSEYWWELAGVETVQPAYFKYDAYLNFGPISGNWQLNAYCKNISEEAIRDLGMMYTSVQAPRTIGVGMSVSF